MNINNSIQISVIIITYNQETLLYHAINSLINQLQWIHEVIISDDCSIDDTFKVAKSYSDKFPDKIRVYKNDENLGIYGNVRSAYSRVTGNVVTELSGDDEFAADFFKTAYQFLMKNVNLKDPFLLYFDKKRVFEDKRPNYQFSNCLVNHYNPQNLLIRGLICEPSLWNPNILEKCQPHTDMGLCADFLWEFEKIKNAEVFYYQNSISHIYHAGIGVSVTRSYNKKALSSIHIFDYIIKHYELGIKEIEYLHFRSFMLKSMMDPNINNFNKTLLHFFKSFTLKYGIRNCRITELLKYIIRFTISIFKKKS